MNPYEKAPINTVLRRGCAGIAAALLFGLTATVFAPVPFKAQAAPARTLKTRTLKTRTLKTQTLKTQALSTASQTEITTSPPLSDPNPTIPSGGLVIAGSLSSAPLSGAAHIRLIEQSPIVRNSGKFTINLELVRGANNDPLEAFFTIHQAVSNRSAFRKTALGNDLGKVLGTSPSVVVPSVEAGDNRPVFSLALNSNVTTPPVAAAAPSVPTPPVALPGPGIYPVRVTLRTSPGPATPTGQATTGQATTRQTGVPNRILDGFTTYLTVVEDESPNASPSTDERLNVALVVPIHLQPSTQPNGTASDPNTAQVIALTEALVRRPIPPLTIAVTPEGLQTLARQADDENPDRRSQVLDQLRSALNGREIIGGPFVEPSPELLDDPNLGAERIRQRIEGERTVRDTLAAPLPGVVVLEDHVPAATSLNELGATSLITSTKALGLLDRSDKDFNEQSIDVTANKATATQPVTIHLNQTATSTTIKGVLVDLALARRCTETLGNRDPKDDNTLRAQQFLAELGLIRAAVPASQRIKHGVNVAIPSATTSATLDAILAGIGADDGMFHAVPMSSILALPVSKTLAFQRKDRTLSVLSSAQREELQVVHTKLLGYNALFAQPREEAVTAERGLRSVLAVDRTATDRTMLLSSLRSQANAMLGGLALVQSKSLTLTAREQTVKIGVLNDSDQPSNAVLDVQSDNVEFIGAQIDPDQPRRSRLSVSVNLIDRVQQIPVRVRTRGPGSFSFVAQLRTLAVEGAPEGVAISSRRYTVRSTAVGKLGTIISVGALTFLGIWWLRSIFRRRRLQTTESQSRHPSTISSSLPVTPGLLDTPGLNVTPGLLDTQPRPQQPPEVP